MIWSARSFDGLIFWCFHYCRARNACNLKAAVRGNISRPGGSGTRRGGIIVLADGDDMGQQPDALHLRQPGSRVCDVQRQQVFLPENRWHHGRHTGRCEPLRYRGYVYDTETGLYYLTSRYYNPVWGRFINADGYASTGQGFTGDNMFAYCNDNPVNYMIPREPIRCAIP